jgi:methyl-accepting chemotaxis protein
MNEPVPLILLFPIILALVLLRSWELICITALEIGVSSAIYILRSNQPMSAGIYAVECALLVLALLALFIIPTRSLTRMLRMQNGQLRAALEGIEARQRTGQQFSHQVLSLAEDLTSTAGQQATGSQQQVSIVSQVTAAVNELSVTAANIDELSEEVNRSAIQVATDSQQIEQTTNLSVSQSEKGLQAANHTLSVSRQMADLYQQLLATMNELATKNARMRHILNLLKSITDETHLLALNAAIEARGAGVFGERFSIVAQEVKRLASRSAEANREVFDIVREVEDAAQAAESSAQSGYAKAKELEEAVGQAEQVIGEMRQVAEHSQAQANSISHAANTVRKLTGQIKSGTAQQRRASEQVTEALTGLTVVAQQSAAGSKLVSATAMNLEQMSQNLNQALVA